MMAWRNEKHNSDNDEQRQTHTHGQLAFKPFSRDRYNGALVAAAGKHSDAEADVLS